MSDQANRLRQLMRQAAQSPCTRPYSAAPAPRLLAIAGAKGGVGATTVAVNLAVALAERGRRTLLVDANLERPDTALLCRLGETGSLADVLSGRQSLHEALVRGPQGILVLCGGWAAGSLRQSSPAVSERLLDGLAAMTPPADDVILDVGSAIDRAAGRYWQAADQVLLVTTPEPMALMDAYAAIKALRPGGGPAIQLLINQAADRQAAGQAYARLARACRRFLGMAAGSAGWLPLDSAVASAARGCCPFVIEYPRAPAARALARLAESLPGPARRIEENPIIHSTRGGLATDIKTYCR
ncbi:MAG: P-loop NTPase [Pirellulales bacterium]